MFKKELVIVTPVVRYWGLARNPFRDAPLTGSRLSLFTCRDEEVADLRDALESPLTGIHGSLGVGKTSFLNMAADEIRDKDGFSVVGIDLGACSKSNHYIEMLRFLLVEQKSGAFKLKSGVIDVNLELKRLDATLTETKRSSAGVNAFLKGEIAEAHSAETAKHSNESAKNMILTILKHVLSPLVLLVDDIERIKYTMKEKEYFNAVADFVTTFKDISNELVAIVVTLDNYFAKHIVEERNRGFGEFSFSFGELIELSNFSPQELTQVLFVRLRDSGWKTSLADFIDEEAFWLLVESTAGHPRKAFNAIRGAMKYVHRKGLPRVLDKEAILSGLKKAHLPIDSVNSSIISFLKKEGAVSASNSDLQAAANLTRNPLAERLKTLSTTLALEVTKSSTASGKLKYGLPVLSEYSE